MTNLLGGGLVTGSTPQGRFIFDLNVALLVITTAVVLARLYVRGIMIKALGLDDALAFIAWCLAVTQGSIDITQVGNGAGSHMKDLSPKQLNAFFSLLPIAQLAYFLGDGFVRLSILAFLPRITSDKPILQCAWVTAAFNIVLTLVAFFFFLFECSPVLDLFDASKLDRKCMSKDKEAYMMWTHAILGTCIDAVLFCLPIWVIRKNMTTRIKAIRVILIFSVGLFAVVTGIVKTYMFMTTNFAADPTFKMTRVCPWNSLELHVGLWCACFPALQPLVRLVSFNLNLRSRIETTIMKVSGGGTKMSAQDSYWSNSGGCLQSNAFDGQDYASRSNAMGSYGDSTTEFVHLDDSERGIRATTNVHVEVEYRNSKKEPVETELREAVVPLLEELGNTKSVYYRRSEELEEFD
ncbi:hypothetical protein FZEAL_10914 [Fusarium zealandicum]|uniref:Rhodopsin domain-containing protein n=1 Tax=Fusarium zealandicum TaxID=1053134 RepID=A0A8H4TTD9_9HYPO|nr:hypothetical protein FZEAL_10914 [Fusarium zealandicum]